MSSSRMIATRRQGVFMAHTCSECGFPMITVVQIEAEAEKTYTFSQSKAERIASETAENAINDEIKRIESCWQTKQPLVGKQKGSSMIVPGHFCTSSFSGFASHCPKCLNLEPWKSASSKKKMDELEKVNFPIVFKSADDAEKWAFDKVRELVAQIEAKREDPLAVERAVEEVKEAKTKIKIWVDEMNSFPEIADCERLKEELAGAKAQKTKLGIFDFKAKKVLNERIKILELRIKDLKEVLDKKQTPIAEKIVRLGNELLTIQAIAFGYTDDILSKDNGNAFSYFFSPNEIPTDIMEEIENQVVNEAKEKQAICTDITDEDYESVSSDEVVYCRKCGFKLLSGSTFCTKCGTKVE